MHGPILGFEKSTIGVVKHAIADVTSHVNWLSIVDEQFKTFDLAFIEFNSQAFVSSNCCLIAIPVSFLQLSTGVISSLKKLAYRVGVMIKFVRVF